MLSHMRQQRSGHVFNVGSIVGFLDVHLDEMAGKQAGDPNKLASLIIQTAGAAESPLHLFAGKIANDLALQKLAAVERI